MVNTGFATIDLKGFQIDSLDNITTIVGIYEKLDNLYNSYKPFLLTNYTWKYATYPLQQGRPVTVQVTRPTGNTFYIEFLTHSSITVLQVTSNNIVKVFAVYLYHNIYTPPTNNSIRTDENEDVNNEVK